MQIFQWCCYHLLLQAATGPSPSLLLQPSHNATGDALVLAVWQPYLNFMMQSIIRNHRKTVPPCYPCVSGAKFKLAFLVCPQLISGMSLSPFDINAGSILICNEQEKNYFHSLISGVQRSLTNKRLDDQSLDRLPALRALSAHQPV